LLSPRGSLLGVFSTHLGKPALPSAQQLEALSLLAESAANAIIQKRLAERKNGLEEACTALPSDMRLPVFSHCVDIILSDGNLAPIEADFLNRITAMLGLEAADAKQVMEVLLIKNRF